jgi:lysyl-tRNA synthetase class 1
MASLREAAMASRAWPFEEARALLRRMERGPPKDHVLFETGYGPSGLPHMGTFGEVLRTTMVRRAFEAISDIPTRLVVFSDDLDGMRKVPDNVPNVEMLRLHLQEPLTSVPDPFGTHESFGHHNNAMLRRFLDAFGFEHEFVSATAFYRSGAFDETLLKVAERYDAVMEIMLASLREERQQTYSCFLPIHPETGRILYVPLKEVDAKAGTITFDDGSGRDFTVPVTGGHVKLQWKPDFGARWAALGVDFEMYGKEHGPNTPIYDGICEALGGRAPHHMVYELFLDEQGSKISKSKGNGLTMDEWLAYAGAESLGYFMYGKPRTAKRLHWDVIPKAVDEYNQALRAFPEQDLARRLDNPAWHIHRGQPPASDMVVPFAMLLNLAAVLGAETKDALWGYLRRYAPDASPETHPGLDAATAHAVRFFQDRIKPTRVHRAPTEAERAAMADLAARLRAHDGPEDPEALQTIVYAVGNEHGFQPLRDWFKGLYEVLLGASEGPRFGGFVALYGVEGTVRLIEDALAGRLAGAQPQD